MLVSESGQAQWVSHINAYLMPMQDIFIGSRSQSLCDVPSIGIGNQPIDDGNYLFTYEEMQEFIAQEPASAAYFRPWYGAQEFLYNKPRYCLWLGDCSPAQLRAMPHCLKRVEAVRQFRLASKRSSTLKLADTPTRFQVENMPKGNSLLLPEVTSEKRQYMPIGFMYPGTLCSNKIRLMPEASLYHFGVLTSWVHMAWLRAICCGLGTSYSYSINLVYNNFPWPEADASAVAAISETAQAILDARAAYPDSSLADLYDDTLMPPALRRAHRNNDRAVLRAYGFPTTDSFTESDCVAR
ncbi:MAG: type IIL restriction-modification enzyme MmeI, partial [Bacteroidales bacterium]